MEFVKLAVEYGNCVLYHWKCRINLFVIRGGLFCCRINYNSIDTNFSM